MHAVGVQARRGVRPWVRSVRHPAGARHGGLVRGGQCSGHCCRLPRAAVPCACVRRAGGQGCCVSRRVVVVHSWEGGHWQTNSTNSCLLHRVCVPACAGEGCCEQRDEAAAYPGLRSRGHGVKSRGESSQEQQGTAAGTGPSGTGAGAAWTGPAEAGAGVAVVGATQERASRGLADLSQWSQWLHDGRITGRPIAA